MVALDDIKFTVQSSGKSMQAVIKLLPHYTATLPSTSLIDPMRTVEPVSRVSLTPDGELPYCRFALVSNMSQFTSQCDLRSEGL